MAITNWGFQPFSIPSASATVPAGGNIQAAVNSLPNGGTVYLEEGTYPSDQITIHSNIVIQGAGRDKTTIVSSTDAYYGMYAHGGSVTNGVKNVILRDFKLDAKNTTKGGIDFLYGISNVLFENLEVKNAGTTNILFNNGRWSVGGGHHTFRNLILHSPDSPAGSGMHGLVTKYTEGVIIENVHVYDMKGYGIDLSRTKYAEIADTKVENCGYGGSKYPSCNYIYIHDTVFQNNPTVGIRLDQGTEPTGKQYMHLENVLVQNNGAGIIQWGAATPPTFQQMVVRNVDLVDNYVGSKLYPNIRAKGIISLHEYDDNIGQTVASEGTVNRIPHTGTTPEDDNVGFTSWPTFP